MAVFTNTEISQALCDFIKENLIAADVSVYPSTPFEQISLDSFSIIEIILFIERRYGLTLPDEALKKENLLSAETLAICISKYML